MYLFIGLIFVGQLFVYILGIVIDVEYNSGQDKRNFWFLWFFGFDGKEEIGEN